MDKNRLAYIIIIVVAIPLGFIVRDCNREYRHRNEKENFHVKSDYKFDNKNYVDPYGITTCYPSDTKRIQEERRRKGLATSSAKSSSKGKYHYRITINNATKQRGSRRERSIDYLNGTYEWDMDLYLPDDDAILGYIYDNYNTMKKYKVSSGSSNIYDDYNNRLDEYLDDPEDELTFDPDVFDFLDD